MEINIGEVNSTVQATDSASLLSPGTLDQIVRTVLERLREEEGHRLRVEAECRLWPGITETEQ